MEETLKNYAGVAASITALIVLATLLWRYACSPLGRFFKRANYNFKTTYDALPVLLALFRTWPQPDGSSSLVDEIKRIDLTLQLTKERLLAHLDFSQMPVFECAVNGLYTHANSAICELFGLSFEDMMGKGWLEGIEPSDRLPTYKAWMDAIIAEIPYETTYHVRNAKTGKRINCIAVAFPLRDVSGAIIAYFGTVKVIGDALVPTGRAVEDGGNFMTGDSGLL
jgi:PAS domain S-box-containing protein